ncbi:hypothetical protein BSL78_01599 [Apostichopus japonicus]|uniref:Reverse transcriptase Ty1/copia-type domain-containing protein n=1 Tax=Stichopus japonicus TaxID=307972 RepID=A0A2G8LML6_STIJA|nr:hypothetical protein BSL78_01599 [Apostichopus japonicus]
MDNEMKALEENDTFKFVKLPDGKNVVGGKWVYTIKDSAQGTKSFKASSSAKPDSTSDGCQFAYLNADIDTEIFVRQPEGYEVMSEDGEELVWKLQKSLYGLKQSGRNWNQLLHEHLTSEGFQRNPADHCLYHRGVGDQDIYVLVWVDDLVIAASNETLMSEFKDCMKIKFKMKDLLEISYFWA